MSQKVLEQIIEQLPLSEVDAAEVYLESRESLEVQAKDQEVDSLLQAKEEGLSLRLEKAGRIGFAYTNELSAAQLSRVIEQARQHLENVEPKHPQFLPQLSNDAVLPKIEQYDSTLSERPISDKIQQALIMEQAALDFDSQVHQVRMCTYQDEKHEVALWSHRDGQALQRFSQATICQAQLMVMAQDESGQEADWNIGFSPNFVDLDCRSVASEAAEAAVGRLNAQSIETGRYPAVLHKSVVAALLGILAPSFLGDAVQKHKSHLAGKLAQTIYAPTVTVVDDGCLQGGVASRPFDGEGQASQRTALVEQGVLQSYLYDTSSGLIDKQPSTGNSVRHSFKEAPRPGTRNLYIEAGKASDPELHAGIKDGVAIHDVIGMHTANPITGDFSVGASGYRIRNGQRAEAIRGFAISGNLHHIFASVELVGSDLKFYGPVGAPSIRISELAVGGT